jgi:CRISPR-associated endonuclease Cas1
MAATQTVPQYSQGGNFPKVITPRNGVVTLFGYGIRAQVERGHLILEDGIGPDRRRGKLPRIGHGLRRLVVIGADGMVSLAALRWLADQKASFAMLDRGGSVLATTGPVSPSDARLRRAQSLAHQSGVALHIAQELIRQKLIGQEQLIRSRFGNEDAADSILKVRNALNKSSTSDEIRRFEAQAALLYWTAWHSLPITYRASDLRRVPAHWQEFGSRLSPLTNSPRLAANPPNGMLNYMYAVLESEARIALAALGLDPGIGVLHNDSRNRDSLACDLMEPVRPQVDAFLFDWLSHERLHRDWFFEQRDGNCRLTSEFAVQLSETSGIWRQAMGPLAEWIAHTLWSSASQPSRAKAPATRLTQRRKREAKGIPISTDIPNLLTSRRECVPMVSRVNRWVGPKPVRVNAHDQVARARRSESQRRQATALKTWNPAEKPDWLDEKFYRERIQPSLHNNSVLKIQNALSVSEPYALRIRSGRCIPHPRHWLRLAELFGVAT